MAPMNRLQNLPQYFRLEIQPADGCSESESNLLLRALAATNKFLRRNGAGLVERFAISECNMSADRERIDRPESPVADFGTVRTNTKKHKHIELDLPDPACGNWIRDAIR
jgi:hypothetical protein